MERVEIGLSRAKMHELAESAVRALADGEGYAEFELMAKENVAPYQGVVIHFSNDDMEREETRDVIFIEVE